MEFSSELETDLVVQCAGHSIAYKTVGNVITHSIVPLNVD